MPELPEVEFAAARLREAVTGGRIAAAEALHPSMRRSLPPADCERLVGRQIAAVTRRAKIQLVTLDDGQVLEVHFRMTGDWEIGPATSPPPAHERLRVTFTDGTCVSLVDSRAFAVVRLHAAGTLRLPALGPEPLDDTFTVDVFAAALATRKGPIKPVLLDQKVVAGIGNIYAAEALWVAKIHPTRSAASLSRVRIARLHEAIRLVLTAAPTGRYYARDAAARAEPESWRVYGREGEPCTRCGRSIRRITQAGRSTHYCSCQK
jgi:formamidopyrimidine-DNA glycosylase